MLGNKKNKLGKKNREKTNEENDMSSTTLTEEKEQTNNSDKLGEDINTTINKNMIAYLVVDKSIGGLLTYIRDCGIKLSNIYNSIEDARNAILMQPEICRIIIADTGLGKFTSTKIRQELIDMLGICDENNKVTVFYTDSVLKEDTIRVLGKGKSDIDWYKYKGIAPMVATILKYKEKYSLDFMADPDEQPISETDVMELKGICSNIETDKNLSINTISVNQIIDNVLEGSEGELPRYNV